ncbi:MAG: hypothetical protein WC872_05070 [Candidatus Absconditabacterales bacterium]|jgi:hypothetical protein
MKKLFFIVVMIAFFATATQAQGTTGKTALTDETDTMKLYKIVNSEDTVITFRRGSEVSVSFKDSTEIKSTGKTCKKYGKTEYQYADKNGKKFWSKEKIELTKMADGRYMMNFTAGDTTGVPTKDPSLWVTISALIVLLLGLIGWIKFK